MHIQNCKSTSNKRVEPDPSNICHQVCVHPLSAISTSGKKGGKPKIKNLPRCISIVGKID